MINKYECKIATDSSGHTYVKCEAGEDDNYIIEPDFDNFHQGGLAIARQFGPDETEYENERNNQLIVIEERDIVDKLKGFLNSTVEEMSTGHLIKEFDVAYKFRKESRGWLRVEKSWRQGNHAHTTDILIHKDVVPFIQKIINGNF